MDVIRKILLNQLGHISGKLLESFGHIFGYLYFLYFSWFIRTNISVAFIPKFDVNLSETIYSMFPVTKTRFVYCIQTYSCQLV